MVKGRGHNIMDLPGKEFEVAICDLKKRNIKNLKSQSVISGFRNTSKDSWDTNYAVQFLKGLFVWIKKSKRL